MHLLQQNIAELSTMGDYKKLFRGVRWVVMIYQPGKVNLAYKESLATGLHMRKNREKLVNIIRGEVRLQLKSQL